MNVETGDCVLRISTYIHFFFIICFGTREASNTQFPVTLNFITSPMYI
jgi:hypothetical protein